MFTFIDHVDELLRKNVVTFAYVVFIVVGAEQVVAGKLDYTELLTSVPLAIATAGVALARAHAALKPQVVVPEVAPKKRSRSKAKK